MPILGGLLIRYFAARFLSAVAMVYGALTSLIAVLSYVDMVRRASPVPNLSAVTVAKASFSNVPYVAGALIPFCVLIGGMYCYLNLSRRLELVVARAAGVSAWQFVSPALLIAFLLGIAATTVYNPIAANMLEQSKRYEAEMFKSDPIAKRLTGGTFWIRQRDSDGQAILNAKSSSGQGINLYGVSVFTFDVSGHFKERIEASSAVLGTGVWRLLDVRIYGQAVLPRSLPVYLLPTNLRPEEVRESFATPETVSFWELPLYIDIANHSGLAAAGYRLQFQKLIAQPFLFCAMVFLAAAVSLRLFRFGGVQKMILSGMASGFVIYILSKVTSDLSKADLMHPVAAAWLPVLFGCFTGSIALLYQEDG